MSDKQQYFFEYKYGPCNICKSDTSSIKPWSLIKAIIVFLYTHA